jgi:hypothetical protein
MKTVHSQSIPSIRSLIMTRHQLASTIFVAWVLIALPASVSAEIAQCSEQTGAGTFTDAPCKSQTVVKRVAYTIPASAARTKASPQQMNFDAAEKTRAAASANKRTPHRRLAVDVSTLKAAKVSLVSMDDASALVRQQALAEEKDRAERSWAFWRS